jgi:hypothetical protein
MFASLGKALIAAREKEVPPWGIIESAVSWEALCSMVETLDALQRPGRFDSLGYVDAFYPQIRRYAPAMLEEAAFQAAASGEEVLSAIKLLKTMNVTGRRKLPEDASRSFVSEKWKPFVQVGGELDRHYYEICALTTLRDGLRSGDIWVPGSRQHQDFERYLLGASAFAELRDAGEAPVAVDTNFNAYMGERSALLADRLDEVQGLVVSGDLDGAKITREGFSAPPLMKADPLLLSEADPRSARVDVGEAGR